jgi:hypothetical protein
MVDAPVYAAAVSFPGLDGVFPVVVSVLGDEAIVGRTLTDRFLVVFDHGRQVRVEE